MVILSDGYAIFYEKPKNRIIIDLPPTMETRTDTTDQVVDRKTDLTVDDLGLLLVMAKYVCKGENEK